MLRQGSAVVASFGVLLTFLAPARAYTFRSGPVFHSAPVFHPAPVFRPAPVYRAPAYRAPTHRSYPSYHPTPRYRSSPYSQSYSRSHPGPGGFGSRPSLHSASRGPNSGLHRLQHEHSAKAAEDNLLKKLHVNAGVQHGPTLQAQHGPTLPAQQRLAAQAETSLLARLGASTPVNPGNMQVRQSAARAAEDALLKSLQAPARQDTPPAPSPSYSFAATPYNTIQVFQNGKLIGTGTADYARQYGYQAGTQSTSSLNPNANWYGQFPSSGLPAGGRPQPVQPIPPTSTPIASNAPQTTAPTRAATSAPPAPRPAAPSPANAAASSSRAIVPTPSSGALPSLVRTAPGAQAPVPSRALVAAAAAATTNYTGFSDPKPMRLPNGTLLQPYVESSVGAQKLSQPVASNSIGTSFGQAEARLVQRIQGDFQRFENSLRKLWVNTFNKKEDIPLLPVATGSKSNETPLSQLGGPVMGQPVVKNNMLLWIEQEYQASLKAINSAPASKY